MLHEDFYTWASANAPLAVLIAGRVYPRILPQNPVLPALVYSQSSGRPETTCVEIGGYSEAVFQLSCIAETYNQAKQLARTLRAELHGFAGAMGGTTARGEFQPEPGEEDVYEDETRESRVDLTFRFNYLET